MSLLAGDLQPQSAAPPPVLGTQRVLAELRDRANDGVVAVSIAELAAAADISTRTVQRAIRHLRHTGAVRVEPGYGPGATATYHLTP